MGSADVVSAATPLPFSATGPGSAVVPFIKVTEPVGALAVEDTAAVSVTGFWVSAGLSDDVSATPGVALAMAIVPVAEPW